MADYIHDELKEGEVWVFNSNADQPLPFNEDGKLKTMRFGKQALDINGHKLSPDYILPVYIHKSELDLMNKRWSEELAAGGMVSACLTNSTEIDYNYKLIK